MRRKIVFKGNTLTMHTCKKNIKHIYIKRKAIEENLWYWDNHWKGREIATSSRINWKEFRHCMMPLSKVLGVISALSPRQNWNGNLKIAEDKIKTGDCGTITQFKDKADAVIFSSGEPEELWDILNGNKTQNFFMNLLYPDDKRYVTVDRHALSIALGRTCTDQEKALTDKQYEFFANCYKELAQELDLVPNFLQSITWQTWRRINNIK